MRSYSLRFLQYQPRVGLVSVEGGVLRVELLGIPCPGNQA